MERMINDRLVWFLESNNIITDLQCGYRHQRSTTDHLVRFETFIREAFLNKEHVIISPFSLLYSSVYNLIALIGRKASFTHSLNKEHIVSVFFDLEKADDTTWKYGILKDIFDMGVKGCLPRFIANFLRHRQFKVRVGSTFSDTYDQEMGVPQGSILSVTLFSIKINSIANALKDAVEGSLYVDDFIICYRSKNMNSVERKLQLCLNNIHQWSIENGFKFSKSKTVRMHFCQHRRLHPGSSL